MKRKFITALCVVLSLLIFALPVMASTEPTVQESGFNQKTFSEDTVITEDNVNDILKYFGLDPGNIIKKDNMPNIKVTVRDIEKTLKESSKLPKTIIQNDSNPTDVKVKTDVLGAKSSGTATVCKNVKITSALYMNYYATGQYYHEGSTKYWTSAGPARLEVATPPTALGFYQLDSVTTLTNQVVNPYTSSSYLRMDYCYAVGYYMYVGVGYILINSIGVSGYTTFGTSYIP
ncbi:hypothetical protein [Pelotomaculum propionicicum]|uniref:Uncharacterized protein n=1 Tax=Pelotomaculum propionicicum TaxID=258475 RepID=A0A4Y7RPI8_9FIRM|nr:hypothetical protein [Pelotomaculum propionicicum]NLI14329.1 hypothetical protein [Peptococcaceae bacterium]TEB10905.1 hypothetical protein Pmgp_02072 [Pelotomaculum propionicicum]